MTMPRGTTGLAIDSVPLGRPLGRAWLRLFGIVPFDFDRLVVVEVQPGRRFLERSSMLSMRLWEHERTLAPVAGGTRVHDRVTFRPRLPVPSWPGRPRTPRGCGRRTPSSTVTTAGTAWDNG